MKKFETERKIGSDFVSSSVRSLIPYYSATDALKYLSIIFKFLGLWLKYLELHYVRHLQAYKDKMNELLKKIHTIILVDNYENFK